jgi:dipeptidyl aminopeptidase/acylaminoacyl peptidase
MRCIPAALLAVALAIPAAAQSTKRPMTFEDLEAMKRVSDPQISPSGKWVMFSVMEVDLARNAKVNHLWLVPADGSAKETQLTFGAGESTGRFSPDGTRFVYVSGGQLYLAAWDDARGKMGPAVELTHIVTEADGPLWSPDGQSLAFVSEIYPACSTPIFDETCNQKAEDEAAHAPTKALIFDSLLYRHWNTYQGAKRSHILMLHVARAGYIFDLTPAADWGANIVAPPFALGGALGYAWAPDSKEFAFVVNADKVPAASTNNDIYTIDVTQHDANGDNGATGWSPKKISTSPGSDDAPAYSPDGKYLAFRSQARAGYESDRFRLMLYDRQAKITRQLMEKAIPRDGPLMGVPAFDSWVDEFKWTPDSKYLVFVSAEKGEAPIYRINVEGTDLHRLGKAHGEWSDISQLPNNAIIGSFMRVDQPATIAWAAPQDIDDTTRTFDVNFATAKTAETTEPSVDPRWLTHVNDKLLAQLDESKMESFTFPGAGGTKVQGFLIRPPNFDPSKKYPLKFLIHGGPQGAWGDAWSYRWNAELMAASGYVVVMINPRGSTGYGQAFIDGVNGDWGGKPYIDLMKGLDFAEAKYPFIDKKRECALGASYGGFMANWILTHTNRFACIVTHDGMFNPQSAYGTTEELWFNEWEFRKPGASEPGQPWRYASGPIADDPFRKWSPMLSIQNAKTPTLVIHSQRDYRLDVSEGFQLFTALQRLNVPSKMLYFPDEGHWVLKPQNSKLWYETVGDWCDRYTHTNKYADTPN